MSKRILLVEDEQEIADIVKLHLEDLNLEVTHAADGIRDRSPSRGLGDVYKRQARFVYSYSGISKSGIHARNPVGRKILLNVTVLPV